MKKKMGERRKRTPRKKEGVTCTRTAPCRLGHAASPLMSTSPRHRAVTAAASTVGEPLVTHLHALTLRRHVLGLEAVRALGKSTTRHVRRWRGHRAPSRAVTPSPRATASPLLRACLCVSAFAP